MKFKKYILIISMIGCLGSFQTTPAFAQSNCFSQGKMLGLISGGIVKSVGNFANVIKKKGGSSIVGVKLCQRGNTYFYNVKFWKKTGKLATLNINAKTGRAL